MERLLYESKGTPKRRAHLLRICGGLICICGAALLLLGMEAPSYVEAKGLIILLGIGAIALGIFFCAMPNFDFAGKACLRLYETYAEGHQVGPSRDFLLPYTEIYNVKKLQRWGMSS